MAATKFAVVTGASTGIGFELAHLAAQNGYDLLVVADEPLIEASATDFRCHGVEVEAVEADLATIEGVEKLLDAAKGRRVDLLCANAGRGLGHGFLEQEVADWRRVIDTNITGTLYLLQKILHPMVARNEGKVLITGSIAGFMPGSFQAVYNGTKAFIDSFADALRNEIKDARGITITNLMPGATETEFFDRADAWDTKVGSGEKDDLALNRREPAECGEKSRAEIGALQFANGDVGPIDGHAVVERHESSPPNRAECIERSAMDNR